MLLTGEVNAAVDGLQEGGATDMAVWDGHDFGQPLSALDIHPKERLLSDSTQRAVTTPSSPTFPTPMATAGCYRNGATGMYNALQILRQRDYQELGRIMAEPLLHALQPSGGSRGYPGERKFLISCKSKTAPRLQIYTSHTGATLQFRDEDP